MVLAATPGGGEQAAAVLQPLADERFPVGLLPGLEYRYLQPAAVYAAMLAAAHATVADIELLWPVASAALAARYADREAFNAKVEEVAYYVAYTGLACDRENMAIHAANVLAPLADRHYSELLSAAAATGLASVFRPVLSLPGNLPLHYLDLTVALWTSRGDGSAGLAALKEASPDVVQSRSKFALDAAAESGRWILLSAVLAALPKAAAERKLSHAGLARGDVPLVRQVLQQESCTAPLSIAGPVAWSSLGELAVVMPRRFLLALAALPECDRISPVAAAAAVETPEAWAYIIVGLDADARRVRRVFGDGTKVQHLVFSPDGARLAALQLPTCPKQAVRAEVERALCDVDEKIWTYSSSADRPVDLQPGEAEAMEGFFTLLWQQLIENLWNRLPLPGATRGRGSVAVYICDDKCSSAGALLWQQPVPLPVDLWGGWYSKWRDTESAMLRPVWLQDGRELVVPTDAGGVGLVLEGHTGAEIETLEMLDVPGFPQPHLVLHVADPDGRELWAVAQTPSLEDDRDLFLARRRRRSPSQDNDEVLWAVKNGEEVSRGEVVKRPRRRYRHLSPAEELLCVGEGRDKWILASVDSRRGPDGVPRLLLSCGLGGVLNTDSMRLEQHLPCFTGSLFTEAVVSAMQLSHDGRFAVGAQATVDLVAGTEQPSAPQESDGWSFIDFGVEGFAVSPDNKRVAFRGRHNGLFFSEGL